MRYPREFEFVVDVPIEEATQRLVDYISSYNFRKSSLKYPRLFLEVEDNGKYKVQGKALLNSVTLVARIENSGSSIKVCGTADYTLNFIVLSLIFYLITGIAGSISLSLLPLLLFIMPIFVVASWLNSRYARRLIIIHLHEILSEKL